MNEHPIAVTDHFVALSDMVIGQNKGRAIAAGGRLTGGVETTTMHYRASQIVGVWKTEESIIWVIDCLPAPVEQVLNDRTSKELDRFLELNGPRYVAPIGEAIILTPDAADVRATARSA